MLRLFGLFLVMTLGLVLALHGRAHLLCHHPMQDYTVRPCAARHGHWASSCVTFMVPPGKDGNDPPALRVGADAGRYH